jgi:ligand-binding SRPBCC domain-containing protein
MPTISLSAHVKATPEQCFDLSRDVSVHTDSTGSGRERAVAGVTEGLLSLGDEVTFEARHLGLRWRMTSKITEMDRPHRFVDEMQRGPFSWWRHVHTFTPHDGGTLVVDKVDYAPPMWPLSLPVERLFLRRFMRRLLEKRNRFLRELAETG